MRNLGNYGNGGEEKEYKINWPKVYFLSGLFLLVLSPVIIWTLTHWSTPDFLQVKIDLTDTGEIGDTIGGITGPIINLIGAVLVYASFKQQLEANRIQKGALEKEIHNSQSINNFNISLDLLKSVEDRLNNLEFIVTNQQGYSNSHKGKAAIIAFANQLKAGHSFSNTFVVELRSYLTFYNVYTRKLIKSEMAGEDKDLIYSLIVDHYRSYLIAALAKLNDTCSSRENNKEDFIAKISSRPVGPMDFPKGPNETYLQEQKLIEPFVDLTDKLKGKIDVLFNFLWRDNNISG